jgi:hypothetical protein
LRKGEVPDSILHRYFNYSLVVTTLNNARYEGFKSSGKLGNMENDSLREAILIYYQQTAPNLAYHEGLANMLQQRLLDYQIDKSDVSINDFLAATKAKALLQISSENLHQSLDAYDRSINQVKTIIKQIDQLLP